MLATKIKEKLGDKCGDTATQFSWVAPLRGRERRLSDEP